MSSFYNRRRGLLSMHRRSGAQVPPNVIDGRTNRFAQSWSDQQRQDALEAEDRLLTLVGWAALAWGCAFAGLWLLMALA